MKHPSSILVLSAIPLSALASIQRRQDPPPTADPNPPVDISINLYPPPNAPTCTNITFDWLVYGLGRYPHLYGNPLTFFVTNVGVPQNGEEQPDIGTQIGSITGPPVAPTLRVKRQDLPPVNLIISSSVEIGAERYEWKVNVPAGWYRLVVTDTGRSLGINANETFQVTQGSDSSCLIPNVPSDPTSGNLPQSTTTPSSASTASSIPLPTGITQPSQRNTTSAMVGGIVGGLFGLGLLLAALLLIRRTRKNQPRNRSSSRGVYGGGKGKWGGLNSVDSSRGAMNSAPRVDGFGVARHASTTAVGVGVGRRDTLGDLDSLEDEKIRYPDAIDMVPPLNNRISSGLASGSSPSLSGDRASSNLDHLRAPTRSSAVPSDFAPSLGSRRNSTDTPSPYQSGGTTVATSSNPALATTAAVNRSPSQQRRTPRKPVPQYKPEEFEGYNQAASSSSPSLSSPLGASPQVHYLIPDMPPPQR